MRVIETRYPVRDWTILRAAASWFTRSGKTNSPFQGGSRGRRCKSIVSILLAGRIVGQQHLPDAPESGWLYPPIGSLPITVGLLVG